ISPLPDTKWVKQQWNYADLMVILAVAMAAIVFFYSGTFFHWAGLRGLYKCFQAWSQTGDAGNGHQKDDFNLIFKNHSWINYYWIYLISRYEAPVLLGVIACLFALFFRDARLRYLAIAAVGTLYAYSLVRYKT